MNADERRLALVLSASSAFIGVHPWFDVMSQRKAFLLRIDPAVLDAVQHWADDDLRSLNAQIEFILRRALTDRGRMKAPRGDDEQTTPHEAPAPTPPAD
jgi:hypothetical protein